MQKQKTTQFYIIVLLATFICYALYVVLFGTLSTTMMDFYSIGTSAQGVFTMVGSIGGIAAALFCALLRCALPVRRGGAAGSGLARAGFRHTLQRRGNGRRVRICEPGRRMGRPDALGHRDAGRGAPRGAAHAGRALPLARRRGRTAGPQ